VAQGKRRASKCVGRVGMDHLLFGKINGNGADSGRE
jgi:hypothetical protein